MVGNKRCWTIEFDGRIHRLDETTKPRLFGQKVTTICGKSIITDGDVIRRPANCKICNASTYCLSLKDSIYNNKVLLSIIQTKDVGEYIKLSNKQITDIETFKECKRHYIYKSGKRTRQLEILGRYIAYKEKDEG